MFSQKKNSWFRLLSIRKSSVRVLAVMLNEIQAEQERRNVIVAFKGDGQGGGGGRLTETG